jgi:hypothetical protein
MLSGLDAIQKLESLSSQPALINEKYSDLSAMDIPKLTETLNIIEEVSAKWEKVLIFTENIQHWEFAPNATNVFLLLTGSNGHFLCNKPISKDTNLLYFTFNRIPFTDKNSTHRTTGKNDITRFQFHHI